METKPQTRKNKDGSLRNYLREVWRDETGKQKVRWHALGDPAAPTYAARLARARSLMRQPVLERTKPEAGSISALIREFKPVLAMMRNDKTGAPLAATTMDAWNYFLGLIEGEHGNRQVADFETHHFVKIRNGMASMPGKANNYMAKFKGLMKFAAEEGWCKFNAANAVGLLPIGEHQPWPPEVIRHVKAEANPMLRLIVVSAYCSGQRISDLIRMQHSWHDGRMMRVPASKKTKTPATIPMHPDWLAEIAKVRALAEDGKVAAVTLLYDQTGKPFSCTRVAQSQLRNLMRRLGYVDEKGVPLYSFHGLSKNAICHLAEQGLPDETISAIVGKTAETVRYYAKETRKWILAEAAADTVVAGRFFEGAK